MITQGRDSKHTIKKCICHVSIMVLSLASTSTFAKTIVGEVSSVGDSAHLEFKGLDNWSYEVKRTGNNVVLRVPAFDDKTLLTLKSWEHGFFDDIEVATEGPDNSYIVTFKLKQGYIESFDYLTDQPSRLIIDFYVDQEKFKEAKTNIQKRKKASRKVVKKDTPKKAIRSNFTKVDPVTRKPASELLSVSNDENAKQVTNEVRDRFEAGVFDAGDPNYERFIIKDYQISEESIIASLQNIYIKFPMLKMSSSQLETILDNPPKYVIKEKDTLENKHLRFLKNLFDRNKNAAYLKTYDFFMKKFPKTKYDLMAKYMAADTHYRMWRENNDIYHYKNAEKLYTELLREYPNSPLAKRTKLLLAYTELSRGSSLSSIQALNQFIDSFPESEEVDRAKFAIAEGFFYINKYDTALEIYNDLIKNHKKVASSIEAEYRKGDVYFKKSEYKKAISNYKAAIDKYKTFETTYPNANFNMAESYFWLGEYKKALDKYIRFVKLYPEHEHNAYALTRIGETLEILGADPRKYMGAYMESYFRFQKSKGAQVARIRMLSKQMKGMKEKELRRTLKEMNEISKNYKLPKIEEFVTLMITDGFRSRQQYDQALKYLVNYYQKNPTSANLDFFKKRIVGNIADSIHDKINSEDFIATLKIFDKYSTTWLQNRDRYDIEYFLARAYELSGVYDEANKIYTKLHKNIQKIEGTREGLERKVNEYLPTVESMNLRLAAVTLSQREYGRSYNYLKKITHPEKLSQEQQVERVSIAARVYEERGDTKSAISFLNKLIKEWDGKEELLSPAYLKLSELYLKMGRNVNAEIASQSVLDLLGDNLESEKASEQYASALKLKADSMLEQGRKLASVEVYLDLLERYENKKSLDYVRYKAGRIIFEEGDIKGAEKIWAQLESSNSQFYWQLAEEKLKNAKWRDSYSKYIKRIPAMKR